MRRSLLAVPLVAVLGLGGLAVAFQASATPPITRSSPSACVSASASSSPSASPTPTTSPTTTESPTPTTSPTTTESPTATATTTTSIPSPTVTQTIAMGAVVASARTQAHAPVPSDACPSATAAPITPALPLLSKVVLKAPAKVRTGKTVRVRVTGLKPSESFTLTAGAIKRTALASTAGKATVAFRAPKPRNLKITVRTAHTSARAVVRVTSPTPRIRLAQRTIRASDSVAVRVSRLVAGEKVTARFDGQVIARGRATARGTWTFRATAGTQWGAFDVTVSSTWATRSARATVIVKQRCATGVRACA